MFDDGKHFLFQFRPMFVIWETPKNDAFMLFLLKQCSQ